MKRKLTFLSIIILVLVLGYTVIKIFNIDEKIRISYIDDYLNRRYEQKFELVKSHGKVEKDYIYTYQTTDHRHIAFEVKYWIGGLSTPWGEQPLIQTRHVADKFEDALIDYVVSGSGHAKYDITNVPLDEVVINITHLIYEVRSFLAEYGIVSVGSTNFHVIIIYEGKEYKATFGDEDYISQEIELIMNNYYN